VAQQPRPEHDGQMPADASHVCQLSTRRDGPSVNPPWVLDRRFAAGYLPGGKHMRLGLIINANPVVHSVLK
jgi:hypothetical protein